MTVAGGIHTLAANAKAVVATVAGVGRFPTPRKRVTESKLALVVDVPDREAPPDDPEYSEEADQSRAVRRGRGHKACAFYDQHGDNQSFSWYYSPRARMIGQSALIMRFVGALVVVEGRNLRKLNDDVLWHRAVEFRTYRKIWPMPEPGEPLIAKITVYEQESEEQSLAAAELKLAKEIYQTLAKTHAPQHG